MNQTIKIALASVLAVTLFGAATAQPAAPEAPAAAPRAPNTDPAASPAGIYKIDPRHTSVTGTILRGGLSHYAFRFDKTDGSFVYDPKNPEASKVTVTIDTGSFDSNTQAIDDRLRGFEFFDIAKFPQITFVSTGIKRTGGNKGTMTGNLTFIGFTKPVTLDVTFNGAAIGKRTTMGFSAATVLKISEFGPIGAAFTTAHFLGNEVPLHIEVLFDMM